MIKGDFQGIGGYLPTDQLKRLREAAERQDARAGVDARS